MALRFLTFSKNICPSFWTSKEHHILKYLVRSYTCPNEFKLDFTKDFDPIVDTSVINDWAWKTANHVKFPPHFSNQNFPSFFFFFHAQNGLCFCLRKMSACAAITKYILRTNMHGVALENFKSTYILSRDIEILFACFHILTIFRYISTSPPCSTYCNTTISGSAGNWPSNSKIPI